MATTSSLTKSIMGVRGEPALLPRTVKLSWTLPKHPDFKEVAVHRRTDQFQTDPYNPFGVEVYRGKATTIYDFHLLDPAVIDIKDVPDIYEISSGRFKPRRNLLPPITNEFWTIDPNMELLGPYEARLPLDDGPAFTETYTTIVLRPNRNYFISAEDFEGAIYIDSYDRFGERTRVETLLGYETYNASLTHASNPIPVRKSTVFRVPPGSASVRITISNDVMTTGNFFFRGLYLEDQDRTDRASNFLRGETLYYYTVFAVYNDNSYVATRSSMVAVKPIKEYYMGERLYELLPQVFRTEDKNGELRGLMHLFGHAFDYLMSHVRMHTDLMSIDRAKPEQLPYIAQTIGWDLDMTLPISLQRYSLKIAGEIYKYAGTKRGLDKLVKVYSGFPRSSGVKEDAGLVQYSVLFGRDAAPAKYEDHITPDFTEGAMDFDNIGTANDPLHYTYDFSLSSRASEDYFIVYVQPDRELTQEEMDAIEKRVRRVVDKFKPATADYVFQFQ